MDAGPLTRAVHSPPDRTNRLDQWVALHGPLSPQSALVAALDLCAQASEMPVERLAEVVGSLNAAEIVRNESGRWTWTPRAGDLMARRVTDADVIERIGEILFLALAGDDSAHRVRSAAEFRARLRSARPDLLASVADVVVTAASAGGGPGATLAGFAKDLRQIVGIDRPAATTRSRRPLAVLVMAALVAAIWAGRAVSLGSKDPVENHGFTKTETALVDALTETMQTFAVIDEQTAALQVYQQLGQLWTARLPSDDPRTIWYGAHEGWIRTLRGDRLTTEQTLDAAPSLLGGALGDTHPYTRAVRLELAATMAARGATAQAATLRRDAEQAARALVGEASRLLPGVPAPPGVVAHLAPNAPEREGFRHMNGEGFFTPLTSIQRWLAGRDGWRLHIVASSTCRASLVVGNVPHLIDVTARQGEDKRWRVAIGGTAPAITMDGPAGDTAGLSLVADGNGGVVVRLGAKETQSTVIDTSAKVPDPPYSFAFSGGANGSGCHLVWLDIPFPFEPKQ